MVELINVLFRILAGDKCYGKNKAEGGAWGTLGGATLSRAARAGASEKVPAEPRVEARQSEPCHYLGQRSNCTGPEEEACLSLKHRTAERVCRH